jgi:hypothetical protein
LEINNQTITTGNITGEAGQMYVCTIAGLTADRDLTLPSAQVGERIGVYIVDGDADYALVLKGAASQTINGGTAATEWSRVFIANESVTFLCIAANTWIVETDMRIPCALKMFPATDTTGETAAQYTDIDLSATTPDYDIGGMAVIASDHALIRRAGKYTVQVTGRNVSSITDGSQYYLGWDTASGNSATESIYQTWPATTTNHVIAYRGEADMALADTIYFKYRSSEGSKGYDANTLTSFILLREILER